MADFYQSVVIFLAVAVTVSGWFVYVGCRYLEFTSVFMSDASWVPNA